MLLERKYILFTISICLLRFSTEQEELFPASEYLVSFVSTKREKKKITETLLNQWKLIIFLSRDF